MTSSASALLVDSREPGWIAEALKASLPEASISVCELPVGDIQFFSVDRKLIVIERKTISDFLNSLRDGRLADQIRRAVESADIPILLVEGEWRVSYYSGTLEFRTDNFWRASGWRLSSVQNLILDLQLQGVICIIEPTAATAETLVRLFRFFQRRTHDFVRRPSSPEVAVSPDMEFNRAVACISSLYGIGPNAAASLLRSLGSIRSVLTADPKTLSQVQIGTRRLGMARATSFVEQVTKSWLPSSSTNTE